MVGEPLVDEVNVRPARRLRGEVRLPGDKSISHRALLLALLAAGQSRITGAGDGRDVRATAEVATALGATVTRLGGDARTVDYLVESPGRGGLAEPEGVLDCRNSGTTFRLVAGILAGLPGLGILDGDASLRRRPMARVAEPLAAMGATVVGRAGTTRAPFAITGSTALRGIEHVTSVPSEWLPTRDHTERMLRARGVPVTTRLLGDGGAVHAVAGPATVMPRDEQVPGDVSGAAFWLVAAAIHPDADLLLRNVGTNPTRRGIIDLLRRMGAEIEERPVGSGPGGESGEPIADLAVRSSTLHGIDVDPAEVAGAITPVPGGVKCRDDKDFRVPRAVQAVPVARGW